MIWVLGLVTAGVMIGVAALVGGNNAWSGTTDLMPVYALALTIAAVGSGWAVALSVRALRGGESSRLPMWVMNLATVPPGLVGLAHWMDGSSFVMLKNPSVFDYYLQVLLPFASIVCVTGTMVAVPLVRWLDRRRNVAGKEPWTRGDRMRAGAGVVAVWCVPLVVLLLPLMLFLSAAVNWDRHPDYRWVAKVTPEFICDAGESVLKWEWGGQWASARKQSVLREGHVSLRRLKLRYASGDVETRAMALYGAAKKDPVWASDEASRVLEQPPPNATRDVFYAAEIVLAAHGSVAQQRAYLRRWLGAPSYDVSTFLYYLKTTDQLIPDLKAVRDSNLVGHEIAFERLIELAHDEQFSEILRKDFSFRNASYFYGQNNRKPETQLRVFIWLIEQPEMRHEWFFYIYNFDSEEILKNPLIVGLVRKFIVMLDTNELPTKRGAARVLYDIIYRSDFSQREELGGIHRRIKPWYAKASKAPIFSNGGIPLPETPDEKAAIARMRELAEEWLAKRTKK